MEELKDKINKLSSKIDKGIKYLKLEDKKKNLEKLKEQMSVPNFWDDQDKARSISSEASFLEDEINNWEELKNNISNLNSLIKDKQAEELLGELNNNFKEIKNKYLDLEKQIYLQGKYDKYTAILSIQAGAGGVDAQDWSSMLERMYLRFAERNNWKVLYLSSSSGSEAGIKSSTFKIQGNYAYGYLKNEAGVHRLVRLSPFDADHARHTSFAMIRVLPELQEVDFNIKDEELKIDTFRASGRGGQSVNTTDSAVRITHIPTGLTAVCQNERSQLQNKKQALIYLKSKLQQYMEVEKEEEKKILKGEYTEAAWGNQIRSYVLHPYKMVKDHRTKYESNNPDDILDGDIMEFIKANLEK